MAQNVCEIKTIGNGLTRPEGVMALDDGSVYTADAYGRCAQITPDGRTTFFGCLGGLPNGICIDPWATALSPISATAKSSPSRRQAITASL